MPSRGPCFHGKPRSCEVCLRRFRAGRPGCASLEPHHIDVLRMFAESRTNWIATKQTKLVTAHYMASIGLVEFDTLRLRLTPLGRRIVGEAFGMYREAG